MSIAKRDAIPLSAANVIAVILPTGRHPAICRHVVTVTSPNGKPSHYLPPTSVVIPQEIVADGKPADRTDVKDSEQRVIKLQWLGGRAATDNATIVDIEISGSSSGQKYKLHHVYGIQNLQLPIQSLQKADVDEARLKRLSIQTYDNAVPKLLIGLDHSHLGIPSEIETLRYKGPYAAHTKLGWVVFGPTDNFSQAKTSCLHMSVSEDKYLHDMVADYFSIESFGVRPAPLVEPDDDKRARQILESTVTKINGRFQAGLLWKRDNVQLPDSYSMAERRLVGIERKMRRDETFAREYRAIIRDYVNKNYARKLRPEEVTITCPRTWYLPHFGVMNVHKPGKLRLVFDAAAVVNGCSLNSYLLKGPQQYQPMPTVLFNFRVGAIAIAADIKEMFHQISIREEDRSAQRFLWRDGNDKTRPDVYEMLVMTFGAACSPCTAHYVKNINALEHRESCPRAYDSITKHHYVDDFVDSFGNVKEAIKVANEVRRIHKNAGFELRNRVAEILAATDANDWRWIPSEENVADEATRPSTTFDSHSTSRWLNGPSFLTEEEVAWPTSERIPDLLEELKRTVAWVIRFIDLCRHKKVEGCLNAEELKVAEIFLCRLAQYASYSLEINQLKEGGNVEKGSELYTLSPFIDTEGVMRVSGRIDAASWLPYDTTRPIILAPNHDLTRLILLDCHNRMKHQNVEATICEVRQRYWVPNIRRTMKKIISTCLICKISRCTPSQPMMGQLPKDRLTPFVRPFSYTGIDYFGPLNVTVGRRKEKRWVALFTCLTTRAIHLEVAADLSTDACILAIRNFINRRGMPVRIRSDNGKNFVGANNEGKRFPEVFDCHRIQDDLAVKGVEWIFNCPNNPAEGGIWERMVRCVKRVLNVTLKEVAPREHTLQSLLIEAENIVNSRPLTHLPLSSDQDEPLTPNHFLLGAANTSQTPAANDIVTKPCALGKQWRIARQLRDTFWRR
ncbi:uncharacterized protein LOC120767802 [Bactrocera tryoni]|uniref:uncharacterized protein LOC120767802 n=1 Tax=Bactrocera tryoni TaxID=59916 RepID=UPI001A962905|nr:uncharacterized protein LOC120767802 [Bactrocera tryoni]